MKVALNTIVELPLTHFPYRHDSMVPNTTTNFYGPDSQQLFERNLKYRTNWVYSSKEVNYNFNTDGLRMKKNLSDIDDDYILFSGTSYTFGVGLADEDRFSNTVARELNLDFINCSGGTYSTKTQIINFFNLIDSYKLPKILVVEYPPASAYTFYVDNNFILCYGKHMPVEKYPEYVNLYHNMNKFDFLIQESILYQHMLRSICGKLNIKLVEITFDKSDNFTTNHVPNFIDINTNMDDINFCYARDYRLMNDSYTAHPGIGINDMARDIILQSL